jgi:hypothetical protein
MHFLSMEKEYYVHEAPLNLVLDYLSAPFRRVQHHNTFEWVGLASRNLV